MNAEDFKTIHRIADIESHRAHHRLSWLSVQDLYQEAWLHLLESWHTYDPDRGALATWAVRRVRGHLYDCIITQRRWGSISHGVARQAMRYLKSGDSGLFKAETLDTAVKRLTPAAPLDDWKECGYWPDMDAVDVPRVVAAVASMPGPTTRAAILGRMRGLSDSEIARQLGGEAARHIAGEGDGAEAPEQVGHTGVIMGVLAQPGASHVSLSQRRELHRCGRP